MSPAAQTQTKYPMLQIKPIPKNTFRLRTSWILSFIYLTSFSEIPYKLIEETTQRKHTHPRYTTFLANPNNNNFTTPKPRLKEYTVIQYLGLVNVQVFSFVGNSKTCVTLYKSVCWKYGVLLGPYFCSLVDARYIASETKLVSGK